MTTIEEVREEINSKMAAMPSPASFTTDPRFDRIESQVGELVKTVSKTDANVSALTHAMGLQNTRVAGIENRQTESAKMNYAPISIAASFIVAIAVTAGSLVAYSIASEASARKDADESSAAASKASDDAQRAYFDQTINLQAQLVTANARTTQAHIDGEIKRIDENRHEDNTMLLASIKQLRESDTTLAATMASKFELFDVTLQREMRLLDDVYTREMELHIKRIDSALDVITSRQDKVDNSRFDANRGDRMQRQLDENTKELKDRTLHVYGNQTP